MAWGVDEVDEEARAVLALLDEVQVVLRQFIEEGDGAVEEAGESAQQSPCGHPFLRVQRAETVAAPDPHPRSPLTWT